MGINSSLYNGLSGVNRMFDSIMVISNNVANINSIAFKAQRSSFHEMIVSGSGSESAGQGAEKGTITTDFSEGNIQETGFDTNMAIDGSGFFMLRDTSSTTADMYTRNGQFSVIPHTGDQIDAYNLQSTTGHLLQGMNINSVITPSTTEEDILIKSVSLPQATSSVQLAVNIEHDANKIETSNTTLYDSWDGTVLTPTEPQVPDPISSDTYDYSTSLEIYDTEGNNYDLTIYFDHTSDPDQKEFLITCDPSLDRRLIDSTTTRYNDGTATANKGAGALLYGVIDFNNSGEMADINCWSVPSDGAVDHTATTNQQTLGRDEGFYSFEYNFAGTGANETSTINFGTDPQAQSISSSESAKSNEAPETLESINSTTSWSSVYDSNGNQVVNGDVITFTGTMGDGTAVAYSYTVDTANTVSDLLENLDTQFSATATINDGKLELTDNTIGDSQLAISAITYADSSSNDPTANTSLAQIFGDQSSSFDTTIENRFQITPPYTTSYANSSMTLFNDQDGYTTGNLENIQIDTNGVIYGYYSNEQEIAQAQVSLALFTNASGLMSEGKSIYTITTDVGTRVIGTPGESDLGFGSIVGNSLEMSNVNLSNEFTDLIRTQRHMAMNSKSITTADEFFETALRIKQ